MEEIKKKRGRPSENGAKRKRINIRVTEDQYDSIKELCELEGESLTDYIMESVRIRSNLTKSKHIFDDIGIVQDDYFDDELYEEGYADYD